MTSYIPAVSAAVAAISDCSSDGGRGRPGSATLRQERSCCVVGWEYPSGLCCLAADWSCPAGLFSVAELHTVF